LVLSHKMDATMVAVVKCNHKDVLVLPFTHALVVVLPLVWSLKIDTTLVVKDMAKTAKAATVVGCLSKMGVVPPPPMAVVMCMHEDSLALPPMHRFSVALPLVCVGIQDLYHSATATIPV